jgi:hypothetical protein
VKLLDARAHALVDYGLVLILALGPTVLRFEGMAEVACYVLAMAWFSFALMTRYGLGVARAIPFGVHGVVELIFAIGVVLAPWIVGFDGLGRSFFLSVGVLYGAAFVLTDYGAVDVQRDSMPRNSVL